MEQIASNVGRRLRASNPKNLTQSQLKDALSYDATTGAFTWLISSGGAVAGCVANCKNPKGYVKIGFRGANYSAHRLAWLFVYGEWPKGQLDHINMDKSDNRICNLRDVDQNVNQHNRLHARRDNKTGFLGVSWNTRLQKYKAQIGVNGKGRGLGYFDSPERAHEAYLTAKRALHGGSAL